MKMSSFRIILRNSLKNSLKRIYGNLCDTIGSHKVEELAIKEFLKQNRKVFSAQIFVNVSIQRPLKNLNVFFFAT